jgi:hypothetical protein
VVPFTFLLEGVLWDHVAAQVLIFAAFLAVVPRLGGTEQFRHPTLGVILHPLGILLLLAIQWYAIARAVVGKPVGWKGRQPR